MNKNLKLIAKNYYKFIDTHSIKSLLTLFSEDITYFRCEQKIAGIVPLQRFYEQERKLQGKHFLKDILIHKNEVIVRGNFKGKNVHGETLDVSFVDFFTFNASGKIKRRHTYLARGFEDI